jgi:hypothetical protein
MKLLTNCENRFSNPLGSSRKLVPTFQNSPVTRKDVPKAGHECTPMTDKESRTEI